MKISKADLDLLAAIAADYEEVSQELKEKARTEKRLKANATMTLKAATGLRNLHYRLSRYREDQIRAAAREVLASKQPG